MLPAVLVKTKRSQDGDIREFASETARSTKQLLKRIFQGNAILIKEPYPVVFLGVQGIVETCPIAAADPCIVGEIYDCDLRILLTQQFQSRVGGGVVHDDDFIQWRALAEQRLQVAREKSRAVVGHRYAGYRRNFHRGLFLGIAGFRHGAQKASIRDGVEFRIL